MGPLKFLTGTTFVAICLVQLTSVGAKKASYTRAHSLEVGKRLRERIPGLRQKFPYEYGFGEYYQGDIFLRPTKFGGRLASIDESNTWPDATVPYVIVGNFTAPQLAAIQQAFDQYAELTCVRFVPRVDQLLFLTIDSRPTGCGSYVGLSNNNDYNNVNLDPSYCVDDFNTPVHELMHALGFQHEHVRPDRDEYLIIHYENLAEEYQNAEFMDEDLGKYSAFNMTSYGVPYNYGSIMHYSRYGLSEDPCCAVLENKLPYFGDFGSTTGLTELDAQQVNARYCQNVDQ